MNELTLFTPVKTDTTSLIERVSHMAKIENEMQAIDAQQCLKSVKSCITASNGIKDTLKRPHIDAGKMIEEHYKKVVAPLLDLEGKLKTHLLAWNTIQEQEKEKKRLQLIVIKAAEDERIRLEAARNVTPDPDILPFDFGDAPKSAVQLRQEIIIKETNLEVEQFVSDKKHERELKALDQKAVKGVQKYWTFEVTDEDQLPRKFLMADESHIRKAIAGGEREIAGCRIWEAERMSAR
jgi:hypothetical protein